MIACAIAAVLACTSYAIETDNQSESSQGETTWSEGPESISLLLAGTIGGKPVSIIPRLLTTTPHIPAPLLHRMREPSADGGRRTAPEVASGWRAAGGRTIELRL
ncbi:MAG TPA: hypothetical protein VHF69_03040 [Candidatus Synoicihabitans sp.]|nr:hypothetical protein [Candidatus Synoicihabitans sp.]